MKVAEDVRLCVEHWITEGWCGVSEEELYDEHGNGGSNNYSFSNFVTLIIVDFANTSTDNLGWIVYSAECLESKH